MDVHRLKVDAIQNSAAFRIAIPYEKLTHCATSLRHKDKTRPAR
jgi:hypothetical protein